MTKFNWVAGGVSAMALLGPSAVLAQTVGELQAQARKIGMPTEASDLRRKPIPAGQNAAEAYRGVQALVLSRVQTQITFAIQRGALPPRIRGREEALVELKPMFDYLSRLDYCTGCDFGNGWSDPLKLNLQMNSELKSIVKDLRFKSDREDARGDWRASLKSLALAARVTADSESDPGLIPTLSAAGSRRVVADGYERFVQMNSKSAERIEAAAAQIRVENPLPNLRRLFGGEIVKRRTLARPGGEVAVAMQYYKAHGFRSGTVVNQPEISAARLRAADVVWLEEWLAVWRKLPKDSHDWQRFRQAFSATDALAKNDKTQFSTENFGEFQTDRTAMDIVGQMQARDRLLLTSIDLLRMRLKNGALPAALPSTLGSTGKDPFDGKPLRYRKKGSGFILYSIGIDRKDDGGHVRSFLDSEGAGYDEVVEFN